MTTSQNYAFNLKDVSVSRRTSLTSTDSGIFSACSSEASTPEALRSPETSPASDATVKLCAAGLAQIVPLRFGPEGGLPHRVALTVNGGTKLMSPWHDVQLYGPNGYISCVCKTPAGTWLRYEVAVSEPMQPLRLTRGESAFKHHTEKQLEMGYVLKRSSRGWQRVRVHMLHSLRPAHYVDNSPWNICMLPQTWGNTGKLGCSSRSNSDGTLGVVEIGHAKVRKTGEVYLVKPLGAFFIQNESGEASWKLVAIDLEDSMAGLLRDVNDVESLLPGILDMIKEWLVTHLGLRPGIPRSFVIKGPYPLSTAVNCVQDHHKAWKAAQASLGAEPEIPTLPEGITLTPHVLQKAWTKFTVKDRKSLLGPVSVSNPNSELLHDQSWFGEESEKDGCDLLVDILPHCDTTLATVHEDVSPFDDEAQPVLASTTKLLKSPMEHQLPRSLAVPGVKFDLTKKPAAAVASDSPTSVLPSTVLTSTAVVKVSQQATKPSPVVVTQQPSASAYAAAHKSNIKSSFSSFWFMWRKKKYHVV